MRAPRRRPTGRTRVLGSPSARTGGAALLAAAALLAGACSSSNGSGATGGPAVEQGPPGSTADTSASRSTLAGVRVTLDPVGSVTGAATALAPRPGTSDLFVTEQVGRVRRLAAGADGRFTTASDAVLDITDEVASGGERGLLGLAFTPDGTKLDVYYTAKDGAITVDEVTLDGDRAANGTRRNLLRIEHPRPNHNGGQLTYGPDGFLYIGTGDGGGGGDPDRNGQNPTTLLGKVLRIDPSAPSGGKPYGIPPGNPFADGTGGAPEVWAYGLRNPWRFSFDRSTGDLWIGDVGQDAIEEIDYAPNGPKGAGPGNNYGWNLMEGTSSFRDGTAPSNHVPPIYEYTHDDGGCSVIGGYVDRSGQATLAGVYLFADICIGRINGLLQRDGKAVDVRHLGASTSPNLLSSFGQGNDGTLYVVQLDGKIAKVTAA
ncbi:MAG: PQQ-dependent sugar dehydrogenase [Acidimicrobiales bacterium]